MKAGNPTTQMIMMGIPKRRALVVWEPTQQWTESYRLRSKSPSISMQENMEKERRVIWGCRRKIMMIVDTLT